MQSKVYEVSYNKNKAIEILERFKILHKHLIRDMLPNPEARLKKRITGCAIIASNGKDVLGIRQE